MKKENIKRIIINHEYNPRNRIPDDWWEVFIVPYEGKTVRGTLPEGVIDRIIKEMKEND